MYCQHVQHVTVTNSTIDIDIGPHSSLSEGKENFIYMRDKQFKLEFFNKPQLNKRFSQMNYKHGKY